MTSKQKEPYNPTLKSGHSAIQVLGHRIIKFSVGAFELNVFVGIVFLCLILPFLILITLVPALIYDIVSGKTQK